MKNRKIIYMALSVSIILALLSAGCSLITGQGISYDPAKRYAAFLVPNSEFGKASLEAMKKQCTADSLEIGPVEYYTAGTKDLEPALKKLTVSKQITVVCINFSSIVDISNIKQSMVNLDYTGAFRYTTDQAKLGQ